MYPMQNLNTILANFEKEFSGNSQKIRLKWSQRMLKSKKIFEESYIFQFKMLKSEKNLIKIPRAARKIFQIVLVTS